MTEEHLAALLATAEGKKTEDGWILAPEGRPITLYVSAQGAGLTVTRVEALRPEGSLLKARTARGEIYVLALIDVYAAAVEGSPKIGRTAGFR